MPPASAAVCAALLTAVVLTVAGCVDNSRSGDTRVGSPSTAGQTPHRSSAPGRTDASPQGEQMKIQITVNGQRLQATIFDSAAGRDLIAQLPLTVDMVDHGSVEKTGPLPAPLSLAGQPDGADPDIGDVGYYAPGNDLVLYYGDQSYYPGIVIIGRLDGNAAGAIADMDGAVTVTVETRAA
jgi:hypothetical protein